jgi:hypothetical protein
MTKKCAREGCGGNLFWDSYDREFRCGLCARPAVVLEPVELLDIPEKPTGYRKRQKPLGITKERNRLLRAALADYIAAHPGLGAPAIADALNVPLAPMQGRLKTAAGAGVLRHEGRGLSSDPYRWYVNEETEEAIA